MSDKITIRECPRCLFTSYVVHVPRDGGQCEYCDLHDRLEADAEPADLDRQLARVRKSKGRYNCLIGISGGLDSSTLLYLAIREWGLRPLVIHFDNGWNGDAAKANMANLCRALDVECITYNPAKQEYDLLNMAFLHAGVPDADIPNDIAMTKLMYQTAAHHGIKWILNGHDFRQEGSTPAKWTYMDAKYISSIFHTWVGKPIAHYPLFTFWDQIKYGFKGIKQIRPFHYITERAGYEAKMKSLIGWKDYGAKHGENIYTAYVGADLLPSKFGINKAIVYLSARVRSGLIGKSAAKALLARSADFDRNTLGAQRDDILEAATSPISDRGNYDRYDFTAWYAWPVILLLVKLKVLPFTFYKKYCKR